MKLQKRYAGRGRTLAPLRNVQQARYILLLITGAGMGMRLISLAGQA
jgi:hypothetical protein